MNSVQASGPGPEQGGRVSLFARLVATGACTGYIPWASGTFGTLLGTLLYMIPGAENPLVLLSMILGGLLLGVPAAAAVARVEGPRLSLTAGLAKSTFQPGGHAAADPSIVVIDEIIGVWIALLFLPKTVVVVTVAFLLFRTMDILKPEPARWIERLPNGWGIMLDDVVAGIYANLLMQILLLISW